MYKIAIVEDSTQDLNELQTILNNYEIAHGIKFTIECFQDAVDFAKNFNQSVYDVIFLDIFLGRRTGIELARAIRKKDRDVAIIFTTSSFDHALESYEVRAFHYLVKPVNPNKVFECISELLKTYKKEEDRIVVKSSSKHESIPLHTIEYLASEGHKVTIFTTHGNYVVYDKLDNLEAKVNRDYFIRTKQSYLINLYFVDKIEGSTINLKSGTTVSIRHANVKEVKRKYMDFLLNN